MTGRGWSSLLLFALSAVSASAELKPFASVPLPCESGFQAISPKGDQVAIQCGDGSIRLVNVASGSSVLSVPNISDDRYSPDGSRVAISLWDGTVKVITTAKPEAEALTIKTSARPSFCGFSANAATLVLSPVTGPGEVWDLTGTPRKVASLQEDFGGVLACAFSPDGKLLVAASGDTGIRFYDTTSWRMVHEYRGLKLESFAIAFTPDGKRILVGGPDSKIAVFDVEGNQTGTLDKDRDVVDIISIFGQSRAAVVYFDGEGRAPQHATILDLQSGRQTPLPVALSPSLLGVVSDQLWLGSAKDGKLALYKYQ